MQKSLLWYVSMSNYFSSVVIKFNDIPESDFAQNLYDSVINFTSHTHTHTHTPRHDTFKLA